MIFIVFFMESVTTNNRALHVLIVGCGLGGLACAIACGHEGLKVTVLEQASELAEVCSQLIWSAQFY